MPIFEIEKQKSKEGEKITATFGKKEDHKVVILNNDPRKKERLLHKTQADRLIKNGKATHVKDAKLQTREVETVVTVEKIE